MSSCDYTDYLSSSGGDLGSPSDSFDDDDDFSDTEKPNYLPEFFTSGQPNHSSASNNKNGSASGGSGAKSRGGKGGRKPCKYVPHAEKPVQVVAKRNARERRRVEAVNSAFVRLRKVVPHENRRKRISKVKTLRVAMDYIAYLQDMIDDYDRSQQRLAAMHHHHHHHSVSAVHQQQQQFAPNGHQLPYPHHHHYNTGNLHTNVALNSNTNLPSSYGSGSVSGTTPPPHPAYLHQQYSPPATGSSSPNTGGANWDPTNLQHLAGGTGGHQHLQQPPPQQQRADAGDAPTTETGGSGTGESRLVGSCLQAQQQQQQQPAPHASSHSSPHPAVPHSLYYPQESLMPGYSHQTPSPMQCTDISNSVGYSIQQRTLYTFDQS